MKNVDQEKLKTEFAASPDLQAEFGGDVKAFVAFKRAEAQGRVQISRPGTSGLVSSEEFRVGVELDGLNRKLAANEAELKSLSGMQEKSATENEARQYAGGVPCTA